MVIILTSCIFNKSVNCNKRHNCVTYTISDNITDEQLKFANKVIRKNKKDGFPLVANLVVYNSFLVPTIIAKVNEICAHYPVQPTEPMSPVQKFR